MATSYFDPSDLTPSNKLSYAHQIIAEEAALQATIAANIAAKKKKVLLSQQLTFQYLSKALDLQLYSGNVSSGFLVTYLEYYLKTNGSDKARVEYVRIIINLLCNRFNGVESTTHFPGNGKLIWQGNSYSSIQDLYLAVLSLFDDFDPISGDNSEGYTWFQILLTDISDDDTFLAETVLPKFADYVASLIRASQSINDLPLPSPDDLTTDDFSLIAHVTGSLS